MDYRVGKEKQSCSVDHLGILRKLELSLEMINVKKRPRGVEPFENGKQNIKLKLSGIWFLSIAGMAASYGGRGRCGREKGKQKS